MKLPTLLIITGLPATGKTTLARRYAERYGAVHLNSDEVRAELGLRGQYTPEAKQRVYEALLARVRQALSAGRDVVMDSVLEREALREPFRRAAAECGAECRWVQLRLRDATARQRLSHPRPDSEATYEVYEKLRNEWEDIADPHLSLQADDATPDDLLSAVRKYAY
ncbi:MAG: AAA family ATPase [Saprospiraceae bacterium]|nr:AAA family ATPase [Saprospiraceae bacterium]MDW8229967.1 AAA family ATPase [Saprospiraceae bacterium]